MIVTGPAALAILAWLLAGRLWRLAATWIMLFGVGMLLVVASKIAFIGWGIGSQSLDFTGLSGHAMRACAVMPVLAYLIAQGGAQRAWRIGGIVTGICAGVLISVSRVM
ncbi:MAG: membrane-associated phospholipid phosphatase, partial [Pseudomonadota bacterium]|nr:membrane-associated phospholipid phosphatase [Pseudomonadota bacterium]